jgi:LysW-gamma-L-lysine carboxypeptidase
VEDSAHASAPWLSKNAIEETMIFSRELKEGLESGQERKSKGMLLTATLTEINGGTSHNITPKECVSTFDIRIPVDMNCKTTEQKISTLVNEIAHKRNVEAYYSIIDETEPFEASHDSPLARAFTLAVMDVEHTRPTLIRKTGTGDMNIIGNQWKIPVVTYGPGNPHEAHTMDEKVSIDEYLRGIEVLKRTIHHLKRLHDKKVK